MQISNGGQIITEKIRETMFVGYNNLITLTIDHLFVFTILSQRPI